MSLKSPWHPGHEITHGLPPFVLAWRANSPDGWSVRLEWLEADPLGLEVAFLDLAGNEICRSNGESHDGQRGVLLGVSREGASAHDK